MEKFRFVQTVEDHIKLAIECLLTDTKASREEALEYLLEIQERTAGQKFPEFK